MNTAISMLRGINVGGQKKVPMGELTKCYESLGFKKIRTYIQSGNVVFDFQDVDRQILVERLAQRIRERFGPGIPVILRSKEEMARVIQDFPFAHKEEEHAHVTFLSASPKNVPLPELEKVCSKGEKFSVSGSEVYLYCPNGYGRTKLTNSFFEKKLMVLATTRNWRTVNALYALANE